MGRRLRASAWSACHSRDTGTLQYDAYFNDDESEAVVIEQPRDSRASLAWSRPCGHACKHPRAGS